MRCKLELEQENLVGGRPTKFNHERSDAILNAIAQYVPYRIAAEANGIGERTLYYWLTRGIADMNDGVDSDFSTFLQSLRKIEQEKIIGHIQCIKNNQKGHKGSQWILEHVFWRYFSSNAAIIELNERMDRLENHELSKSKF